MTHYYEVKIEVDAGITFVIASDAPVGGVANLPPHLIPGYLDVLLKESHACVDIDEQVNELEWPEWRVSNVRELDDGRDVKYEVTDKSVRKVS